MEQQPSKETRVPNEAINELVVFYGAGASVGTAAAVGAGQHDRDTSCRQCCGSFWLLGHLLKAWIRLIQKRILTVMNTEGIHFVTLEILLHEGRMNVYDCNLMVTEHAMFLTLIQPVFELLPKLLKKSEIMNHLPEKFLTQPWKFNGQTEPMVQNATRAACGSYSLAFIQNLISRIEFQPPNTLLCDNLIERMQYVWAYEIISQSLKP
ncbi:hypothetical protein EJD97_018956 [Solanum chilense]|uniref:Ubiquitin-like protease family profile domain-containing protein n=1 Tax=Solanum chilense TaxID=4083 RepID=A0A6N2B834_SOLCI|nr:hypothetical protein EJD97_018956 [Solanum chilense]